MASPTLKHCAHKGTLAVHIGSKVTDLRVFSWLRVSELKTEIYKVTGIPTSEQRLFNGHIELQNSRFLEDYSLFDALRKNKTILLEFKHITGSFMRLVPGAYCEPALKNTILDVHQGLKLNLAPNLTWDGTGGTYFMRDPHRNMRGVFKPIDEEAYAPMNPRGYIGNIMTNGIRSGILSGESAYREVAAYLLDHTSFSGVPMTALVESQHASYNYNIQNPIYPKKGSFQEFKSNIGSIENFSPSKFSKYEIQKIAILDIRTLNMDRNEGNILVTSDNKLIPIDHGLCMPDCFDINEYDICWTNWQQCKEPIDNYCMDFINSIDPVLDITVLKETMPFRDTCLRNIRISSLLLKKGAAAGLNLAQISSMLYREKYDQKLSVIELVVSKSIDLYKTIAKSLTSRLKLEKCLYNKIESRVRTYSNHEIDSFHVESSKTQTSTPGEPEGYYDMVMTINEVKEEEDDEELQVLDLTGRSWSLPSFKKLTSKTLREKNEAFDKKLFYYIEAFIELAVQKKVRDLLSKVYLEYTTPDGRTRSISDIREDDIDFSIY
jgi:Phosphatidylinositol 3- and 4-kinase